jgi:hypothetical protein
MAVSRNICFSRLLQRTSTIVYEKAFTISRDMLLSAATTATAAATVNATGNAAATAATATASATTTPIAHDTATFTLTSNSTPTPTVFVAPCISLLFTDRSIFKAN